MPYFFVVWVSYNCLKNSTNLKFTGIQVLRRSDACSSATCCHASWLHLRSQGSGFGDEVLCFGIRVKRLEMRIQCFVWVRIFWSKATGGCDSGSRPKQPDCDKVGRCEEWDCLGVRVPTATQRKSRKESGSFNARISS